VVLAGSEDSTVWMWNADNGSYLNLFSGHGGRVSCGDFTPDGKQLFFNFILSLIFVNKLLLYIPFSQTFLKK
jgi:WD40 repeat protein